MRRPPAANGSSRRQAARLSIRLLALASFALAQPAPADETGGELRVCSDPNNMPFSDRREEGFENRIAELVGRELGREVRYVWRPQRRGFIRQGLAAGICDLVVGTPKIEGLLATRPYYRSTYVFVSRQDRRIEVASLKDPLLRELTVGVHLIGDDGWNTPPAHALAEQGVVSNVVGFSIYGDYADADPPARLINAVEAGTIDIAVAWGPLAGYLALHAPVPLRITPVADGIDFIPLVFDFPIGMGVRRGEEAFRDRLNVIIAARQSEIDGILRSFGVPLTQ
jgi:quinoprotein dehydrogenase-associated probable ABC transporter substrate-binding protein